MQVIDVAHDRPLSTDRIFVDTNVWLFLCYEKATFRIERARQAIVDQYIRYVGRGRSLGAQFITFPTVLFEVARFVEREEYFDACRSRDIKPFARGFELKTWRSSLEARKVVASSLRYIWSEIMVRGTIEDALIKASSCPGLFDVIERHSIDVNDAMHRELLANAGVSQILSDDIDFVDTESPLTLLTHNQKALSAAAGLNLLVRR